MNYENRTEEIFNRAEKVSRARKKRIKITATSLGLAACVAAGCVLFIPYSDAPVARADLSAYEQSEYYALIKAVDDMFYSASSASNQPRNNWQRLLDNFNFGLGCGSSFAADDKGTNADMEDYPDSPSGGDASAEGDASYEETTDNQVEGVIEADLFKRSSDYIYYLHAADTCTLQIYSIAGENSALVSEYTIVADEGYNYRSYYNTAEMYLSADCSEIFVITQAYDSEAKHVCTAVIPLDVSDAENVTQGQISYVSGSYISSRMTDGDLLLITQFTINRNPDYDTPSDYLPCAGTAGDMIPFGADEIILPESPTYARYTVVAALSEGEIKSHAAFLSYASGVYVSGDNIYVTRGYYENVAVESGRTANLARTDISCVSHSNGNVKYEGTMSVNGDVLNQYSMDEKDGVLRVATTVTKPISNENSVYCTTNASLYCIDIDTLETAAALENFAPDGEEIKSVRFDGDKVYVCTSLLVQDPVFVIDLTDPENISVKDTGEIGGYSVALRKFKDGTLLGMGYDESWGFKAEIYAETADGVDSLAVYKRDCSFSTEYKSYFIDEKEGLIGLCVYDYTSGYKYLLLRYDGENIVVAGEISVEAYDCGAARACLADGYVYILTGKDFKVICI